MSNMNDTGKCLVLITHKHKGVMDFCDIITVLRQGKVTGSISKSEASPITLARMMVGRNVEFELKRPPMTPGEEVFSIDNLTLLDREGKEVVKDLSLKVRRGEIFGIAGVEGNGQTELAEAIAGIRRVAKGSIRLKGTETAGKSSSVIRRRGAGLIPEDRRQMGLILEMNLEEHVILGKHRDLQFRGSLPST